MTKRILVILCTIFFTSAAYAAAGETRYVFAGSQASITVPADVSIHPSAGLPPDNELANAIRGGRRILGIYAGNYPDTRSVGGETAVKETIAGRPALTYRLSAGKGRSRQTFVQVRDDGFPNVIHFFYSGDTDDEAAIADKMIESLKLEHAAAAQR